MLLLPPHHHPRLQEKVVCFVWLGSHLGIAIANLHRIQVFILPNLFWSFCPCFLRSWLSTVFFWVHVFSNTVFWISHFASCLFVMKMAPLILCHPSLFCQFIIETFYTCFCCTHCPCIGHFQKLGIKPNLLGLRQAPASCQFNNCCSFFFVIFLFFFFRFPGCFIS